jgi:hypothetical protein
MTERLNHKLDISKIKTIKDIKNVFDTMSLVACMSEDNEQYEIAKEYYTIPYVEPKLEFKLPRQSLEEISQECEEKFDDLLVKTKRKFAVSKETAEHFYNQKFNRIIENFEYARKNGRFPYKLDYTTLSVFGDGSNSVSFTTQFRIGVDEVGYWDIKPNIQVYLRKKPNMIVRFFTKLLLDFTWKDK